MHRIILKGMSVTCLSDWINTLRKEEENSILQCNDTLSVTTVPVLSYKIGKDVNPPLWSLYCVGARFSSPGAS